jgi:signal transduction histidine kinase
MLPVEYAYMGRYGPDRTITVVAVWGRAREHIPVGSGWILEGRNLSTIVFETGRPIRVDSFADVSGPLSVAIRESGVRSGVGTPIVVEGRLWGVMAAGSTLEQPMPADTEARLASFTELLATAIANAESRAGLARLAEEQAALRRVATLVAGGMPPEGVFAAVTDEVRRLLRLDVAGLGRYESDNTMTVVAVWGTAADRIPIGQRQILGGNDISTLVFETGRPARIDDYAEASGPISDAVGKMGVRSAIGTPIIVEGRLWGMMSAASTHGQPLQPGTEARLVSFTELLATAISNAENRTALAASRARIVAAADETRRRIERDLHDGTQQQLVSLLLELRAAQTTAPRGASELTAQLARTERGLAGVLDELQEISRGIHPAILSKGGLEQALRVLARRSAVAVELDLHLQDQLPSHVEVATYYMVSEALTNAAKHARASVVKVELDADGATVRLAVRDDGIGGADLGRGSGLIGLSDRIEALGGSLRVTSPTGRGTTLLIEIPLETRSS